MSKTITLLAILAATAATAGCQTVQQAVGATKVSPDEFRVVTAAPLTLPPDYSLRPPAPGAPRPTELDPDAQARAALFGTDVARGASTGERALITAAGAEAVDPSVRDQLDFETQSIVHRNESFADRIIGFRGSQADAAAPLDAAAEQRRLAEQEAIRRATGGQAVTIQRDAGGFKLPGT